MHVLKVIDMLTDDVTFIIFNNNKVHLLFLMAMIETLIYISGETNNTEDHAKHSFWIDSHVEEVETIHAN